MVEDNEETVKPLTEKEFIRIQRLGGLPDDIPRLIETIKTLLTIQESHKQQLMLLRRCAILMVNATNGPTVVLERKVVEAIPPNIVLRLDVSPDGTQLALSIVNTQPQPKIVVPNRIIRPDEFTKPKD